MGDGAVELLRTYPAQRLPYLFARYGERTVARGYVKVLSRAERFVHVEDQVEPDGGGSVRGRIAPVARGCSWSR